MVRRRLTPTTKARLLVALGAALLSVAAGLIFIPAGLAVGGASCVLAGLFLVNVEGSRESSSARPKRPPI